LNAPRQKNLSSGLVKVGPSSMPEMLKFYTKIQFAHGAEYRGAGSQFGRLTGSI
jgi:hypothetical protein